MKWRSSIYRERISLIFLIKYVLLSVIGIFFGSNKCKRTESLSDKKMHEKDLNNESKRCLVGYSVKSKFDEYRECSYEFYPDVSDTKLNVVNYYYNRLSEYIKRFMVLLGRYYPKDSNSETINVFDRHYMYVLQRANL